MNKNRSFAPLLTSFLAFTGIFLTYILFFRKMIRIAYQDHAPAWFAQLLEYIYPRFFVERHRFPVGFFLNKGDQIMLRLGIVFAVVMTLGYLRNHNRRFSESLNEFWNHQTSIKHVKILQILFFLAIILIFHDIYSDLMKLSQARIFYKPVLLYKALGIGFPSDLTIVLVCSLLFLGCITGILNLLPVFSSVIVVLLFIYIQGIIFGFEKTDHGFATFTYAGMIMPFLLYEHQRARQAQQAFQRAWPLTLIRSLIALCYLFSGLEKIITSGFLWLHPDTFRSYLLIHHTPLGLEIADIEWLCFLLPAGALLFQLGFISILFKEKLKYLFLPLAVVFHIGSYYLFDAGGFTNPWMLSYIFFIDWSRMTSGWSIPSEK